MDLLTIVQTACDELGLVAPSAVATATDVQTRQLFRLTNRENQELQQSFIWSALQKEFVINVRDVIETTGDVTLGSANITNIPDDTGSIVANLFLVTADDLPVAARVIDVLSTTSVQLQEVASGTAVAQELTFSQDTYAVPSDFDFFIGDTWWDRTNRWRILGPDSPQIDQWHRSGIVVSGPRKHFRKIGPLSFVVRLWPPPVASDTPSNIVFEYISANSVQSAASTTGADQAAFEADTDEAVLDPQALILGLKWRWLQVKRFQYADAQMEYLHYVDRLKARDMANTTLSLSPGIQPDYYLIGPNSVQDGNWPSST